MDLTEFYPPSADLIKSELNVLDHLMDNPYITEKHSTFAQDARKYYSRNKDYRAGFQFFSYLDVCHAEMPANGGARSRQRNQKPNLKLVVAAKIELAPQGRYSNVSYCLAVCRIRAKRPAILRKFHFDVTVSSGVAHARRQQHPVCHLQYCGELIPQMSEIGCGQAQLEPMHPSLSEPRVFFWPMSLALLIDMALHEFPDPGSKKFRETTEWRSLVRSQEDLILRPFYQKCVDVIVDVRKNHRTLAEEFYVN